MISPFPQDFPTVFTPFPAPVAEVQRLGGALCRAAAARRRDLGGAPGRAGPRRWRRRRQAAAGGVGPWQLEKNPG